MVEAIFNKPATLTDVRLTVSSSEGNGYLYIFLFIAYIYISL